MYVNAKGSMNQFKVVENKYVSLICPFAHYDSENCERIRLVLP